MIEPLTLASWVLVAVVASMVALYGVGIVLTEHKVYPSWFAVLERADRKQKRLEQGREYKKQWDGSLEASKKQWSLAHQNEISNAWVLTGERHYCPCWKGEACNGWCTLSDV